MRAVVDTSVWVSALIRPQGAPGQVLRLIRQARCIPIFSTPIVIEIIFCIDNHLSGRRIDRLLHLH